MGWGARPSRGDVLLRLTRANSPCPVPRDRSICRQALAGSDETVAFERFLICTPKTAGRLTSLAKSTAAACPGPPLRRCTRGVVYGSPPACAPDSHPDLAGW